MPPPKRWAAGLALLVGAALTMVAVVAYMDSVAPSTVALMTEEKVRFLNCVAAAMGEPSRGSVCRMADGSAHTSTRMDRDRSGVLVDLGCRELTEEGGSRFFVLSKTSGELRGFTLA